MEKFAKLFDVDGIGQILVVQDGEPSVKFMFTLKSLGICSVGSSFPDTDEGRADCDKFFDKVDAGFAVDFITPSITPHGIHFG